MQNQRRVAKRIKNHYDVFRDKAPEYQTVANAQARLNRLSQDWDEFQVGDEAVRLAGDHDPSDAYMADGFFIRFVIISTITSRYTTFIEANSPKVQAAAPLPAPVTGEQGVQFDLNSLVRSLPQLDIPKFSGVQKSGLSLETFIHHRFMKDLLLIL